MSDWNGGNHELKLVMLILLLGALPNYANAAWLVYGVWYSNVCRADGNPAVFFIYPPEVAQPVGTSCQLPGGIFGTVTPN